MVLEAQADRSDNVIYVEERGGEVMEMITVKRVKARKNHICDTCGSNIFKGEEYELQTNKFEGEIYTWKNCDHCKSIRKQMFTENYYSNGATDQDFLDFISEHDIDFRKR